MIDDVTHLYRTITQIVYLTRAIKLRRHLFQPGGAPPHPTPQAPYGAGSGA